MRMRNLFISLETDDDKIGCDNDFNTNSRKGTVKSPPFKFDLFLSITCNTVIMKLLVTPFFASYSVSSGY